VSVGDITYCLSDTTYCLVGD